MDPAMFDSLPGETQAAIVEGAKGYYNSSVVPSYTEGGVAPKDWDELELDEKITGKTYVTFNPQAESQTDMFQPEPTGTRTDVTYLTQKGFSQFVEDTIKDRVQRLLYSAGTITDIHLDELMEDLKDMNGVTEDITNALATGEEPSASTMELLHVVDRFILYQGVGQHPSKKGCEAMADDVLLAYQKLASGGNTAFDDMKEQIMAMLESVKSIFDGTPIGADIDDAITKLAAVKEMMDIIDEQGLTADDLREFLALKEQFQDLFTETLDLLGLSVDDLKQAMEETTPEQLAEIVNKIKDLKELVDILDEEGLTADQLKEVLQMKKDLEARMNEVLDALGLTMDDVMAMLDENSSPEKIKEYVEKYQQIKEILDVLDESGLTADQLKQALQLKEDLEEGLNKTLDALGITIDDLIAQGEFVANAVDWEKVAEIIKTVNDIVQDLPGAQAELEAKIKEYIEELLVPVEAFIDDVMKTAQEIYDAVDVNEIAKAVEKVNEILENLPTTEEVRA
ncbi:MAG: hypothetical protein IIZ34_01700, partial [Eubacterium sp.]|nr:hypothetical protein [Eubacterium sp.]